MNADEVYEALRQAGYRLTDQRRKLVELLLNAEAPLTADELYQRARAARVEANLSTIYRNLATFCDMGWLDALPGPNGERYYAVHASDEHRMSVMCLDCGQMTTLTTTAAAPLNQAVRDLGFNAQTLRVTMAAHCEHVCPRKSQ